MLGKKKKQKLSAHRDFLQKVDEEFEKVGTFRAVPVKSKGVVGEGGCRLHGDRGSPCVCETTETEPRLLTEGG